MVERFSTSYNSYGSIDELIPIDKKLLRKAEEILEQAYSVYSGFSVGAAALLETEARKPRILVLYLKKRL